MRLGYVGLGRMGGALARRLLHTQPLSVYDVNPAAAQALLAQGARGCTSLRELADACDVVLLCLPTSNEVREAILGPDGLAAALRPGTLLIDQTTGDPHATQRMAAELAGRGVALVDAPVSGGVAGAEAGTIAIMVGAGEAELARARPVLAAISPNLFHAGGVGAGQVMKLVNNHLSGAQRLLTLESVALAARSGIDARRACEILLAGGARNAFLERQMAPHVIEGRLDVNFTLGLMHKDMRLACDLGAASGVPLLFGSVARELYQLCINEQGPQAQVNTAALVMDRLAGTQVVQDAAPRRD